MRISDWSSDVCSSDLRSARILLINDLNSRIPVLVEPSRERAVLAGDNSSRPRLVYLDVSAEIGTGDRVVTSGQGGVLPPGIPVGIVSTIGESGIRVAPFAKWSNLEYVRLMDYGLDGVLDDVGRPRMARTQ